MAISTSNGGLVSRKSASNGPVSGGLRRYSVPATDSTALYVGDPVIKAGDGDADGTPTATIATAAGANRITGVVVGIDVSPTTAAQLLNYRPASTAGYVLVDDDPNSLFEIQEDGVGGFLAATNIGQNCSLIAAAGNSYGSGWLLDSSTAATTSTLQVNIVGLSRRPNNVIGGFTLPNGDVRAPYWLVRINQHTEAGVAGAGV